MRQFSSALPGTCFFYRMAWNIIYNDNILMPFYKNLASFRTFNEIKAMKIDIALNLSHKNLMNNIK
jgi:hypothetical protein